MMAAKSTAADIPPAEENKGSSVTFGHTELKLDKFSHTWTLNNFSYYPWETPLKSPRFSVGTDTTYTFYIELNLSAADIFTTMKLRLTGTTKPIVKMIPNIHILSHGDKMYSLKNDAVSENPKNCWTWYCKNIRYALVNKKDTILIDDVLTILCEGTIAYNSDSISGRINTAKRVNVPVPEALTNLGLLLNSQKFIDMTLTLGKREFGVHKLILAAQSPVFAAMFEHEMVERKNNRVEIEDMDCEVLAAMLQFIYTDEAKNLKKTAKDQLVAADRYQLNRLKVICEAELATTLDLDNAAEMLIFADFYNAHQLKAVAIDLIVTQIEQVVETAGFKLLLKTYPLLATEIFLAIAKK